jgi:hypothetical protein
VEFSYRLRRLRGRSGFLTINRNQAAGPATAVKKDWGSPLNDSYRNNFPHFLAEWSNDRDDSINFGEFVSQLICGQRNCQRRLPTAAINNLTRENFSGNISKV